MVVSKNIPKDCMTIIRKIYSKVWGNYFSNWFI